MIAHKLHNSIVYKNQIAVFIIDFIEKISNQQKEAMKEKERRKERTQKKYGEKIDACGKATNCKIIIDDKIRIWRTFRLPYKIFVSIFEGKYIPMLGYFMEMGKEEFSKFMNFFDTTEVSFYKHAINKSKSSVSLSVV